jgi:hypothetical protein
MGAKNIVWELTFVANRTTEYGTNGTIEGTIKSAPDRSRWIDSRIFCSQVAFLVWDKKKNIPAH